MDIACDSLKGHIMQWIIQNHKMTRPIKQQWYALNKQSVLLSFIILTNKKKPILIRYDTSILQILETFCLPKKIRIYHNTSIWCENLHKMSWLINLNSNWFIINPRFTLFSDCFIAESTLATCGWAFFSYISLSCPCLCNEAPN